jgi:hypothetical protein
MGGATEAKATNPANLQQLKRGVAVTAVTAYALADAESRIGPRQSPSRAKRSIDSMALESQLKAAGLWDEWLSFNAATSR